MDYAYSFLLKVSISIVLLVATFNTWKTETLAVLDWVVPLITIFWVAVTAHEGIKAKKRKIWFDEKEGRDERAVNHSHKAGYFAFWMNTTLLSLLFVAPGVIEAGLISPLFVLIALVLMNIVTYLGLKLYFIFRH